MINNLVFDIDTNSTGANKGFVIAGGDVLRIKFGAKKIRQLRQAPKRYSQFYERHT